MIEFLKAKDESSVFVVGDIHGEYSYLIEELNKINFNFENDLLIAVGDIVDRGNENIKCVQLLDKKWFKSVMGNHEDFCIQGLTNSHVEFYHKMKNNGGSWFYDLSDVERNCVAEKFKQLPVLIELEYQHKKFGFVHADVPVEDWELLKEMVLNKDHINNGRSIIEACLWSRRIVEMETVEIAQVDNVFLGHTVLPEIKQVGNCTFLDTGGVFRDYDQQYKLSIIKL